MRTSLSQQIQNSLTYINLTGNTLTEMQNRVSSGKRITKASDDVLGTSRVLTLNSNISSNEQMSTNIDVSEPMLKTAEASLSDIYSSLNVVKTKALSSINSAMTDEARAQCVSDLNDILENIQSYGNTKYLDKYVFSGTETSTETITNTSGTYSYGGNDATRQVKILSNVTTSVNIPGSKVFNFDGSAGSDVPDLFTTIENIRDAISSNDTTAVSDQLKNLEANADNVLSCEAQTGSWISRMDDAKDSLTDSNTQLKQMLSDVQDVDIADAIIQLKTQENVYQAALAVSTKILNLSLASLGS